MSTAYTGRLTEETRAFVQQRTAQFGLIVAAICVLSLSARIVMGLVLGYFTEELSEGHFWAHVATGIPVGLVWLICRGKPLPHNRVIAIEAVGLWLTSIAFIVMGAHLPALNGAAIVTVLALTFGIIARAVFVPSTPRHTAWLGAAIAVPLAIAVYRNFLATDLRIWNSLGFYRHVETPQELAIPQTIQIVVWWGLVVFLATWTTRVIYGLRKEARDARKLGQYTLEEKLGEGGMGTVYRAQHGLLKRPTAIKLLLPERNHPEALDQFRREVQLTAKLSHPNTVTIYDYGRTDDGTFYYAMELLHGATLDQIVESDGPQCVERVVHVMLQSALALEEAHALGLVHRDIKTGNIMLTQQGGLYDVTKVLDFGLVKNVGVEVDATVTQSNAIKGTPLYMSPEQISDPTSVDQRSDLYALACVAYQMLTGRVVFDGRTAMQVCAHHLNSTPTPPSEILGDRIPQGLDQLIIACLSKDRDARPASALDLAHALMDLRVPQWTQDRARAWWAGPGASLIAARVRHSKLGRDNTLLAGFED